MLRRRLGAISDGGHDVSKHGACFGPSSSSGPHTIHVMELWGMRLER